MKSLWRSMDGFFSAYMPDVTRRFFYSIWSVAIAFWLARIAWPRSAALFSDLVLQPVDVIPGFRLWQLLTYGFLHSGLGHLLANSLALLFFGAPVEHALGRRRYTAMIFTAILAGGLVHTGAYWGAALASGEAYNTIGLLGFSGAVFAILVGCLFVAPNATVYLYFVFPMKLKHLVILFLAVEVFWLLDQGLLAPVSHIGHLCGAAVGFAFFLYPRIARRTGGPRGGRVIEAHPGGRTVRSRRLSMGHPGRSANADDRYDDPHWRLDQ
ncbi:rhomboid family intramembrane serine protease [Candidatus Poribacteria bacterium]|nr:rhomboid family intramembrane serine protease [Candidatus Poribacteria bacterium]